MSSALEEGIMANLQKVIIIGTEQEIKEMEETLRNYYCNEIIILKEELCLTLINIRGDSLLRFITNRIFV